MTKSPSAELQQIALLQLGSIIKDVVPVCIEYPPDYLPSTIDETAHILYTYLNVEAIKGDNILDLRDRAVEAYNTKWNTLVLSATESFDRAMKGI